MSTKWNINQIRKIAGLSPITESWDRDDDDEDPDVKIAMGDKRQREFEKKNKPELDAAKKAMAERNKAQKEAAAKKKAAAAEEKKAAPAKAEEKKPEPKKEAPKAEPKKEDPKPAPKEEPKAEPKAEEKAAEAKRRGAKPNENSKSQRALAWIRSNPSAKRGEFLRWAKENLDMGAAYGSAFFARHNPKSSRQVQQANESWVITHPSMPSFILAENREKGVMQWIDPSSQLEPMIFTNLAEAEKVAKYMSEWKSQYSNIEHIIFED